MTLFLLSALTMVAFAANSILTRAAVDGAGMDPLGFALVRVASGAAVLAVLVILRGRGWGWSCRRLSGAFWLALYMVGFSAAYVALDAGLGALILFGGVQLTMFGGGLLVGARVPARAWAGMVLALAGLAWLLWPGPGAVIAPVATGYMLAGALGWGIYSLKGRAEADALAATAGNFLVCLPMVALVVALTGWGAMPVRGLLLALVSGGVTSGLGYALWYRLLPRLTPSTAAVAQLSAPVIAVIGGAVLLREPVTARIVLAGALVLGGIAVATVQRRIGSSGS